MNRRYVSILITAVQGLALLLLVLLAAGSIGPLQAQGASTADATLTLVPPYIYYQGRLTNPINGLPVPNGTYTMTFRLYVEPTGGTAIAVDSHPVTVTTNGLFRTYIGFEADSFNGQTLWVGVQVKSDPEMTPRHYLRPVPYALSLRPGAVISGAPGGGQVNTLSLVNADGRGLNAQTGSMSAVAAQNNSDSFNAGAIAGINDGTGPGGYFRSAGGDALNVDGSAFFDGDVTVNGTVWARSSYQNVIIVAKHGGDFTSIQAAIDSASGATQFSPYLVRVMPGVYEEQVDLSEYVYVQGSGQDVTVISYTVSYTSTLAGGTVTASEGGNLSDLTVINTHAAGKGAAIYSRWSGLTIDRVTASATGGTESIAIYSSGSVDIRRSTASASASDAAHGIWVYEGVSTIVDTVAHASDAGDAYGILVGPYAETFIDHCTASASDAVASSAGIQITAATGAIRDTSASAQGGLGPIGIEVIGGSTIAIVHSDATGSGGYQTFAIHVDDASTVSIVDSSATAGGQQYSAVALLTMSNSSVDVQRSTLSAIGQSETVAGIASEEGVTTTVRFSTVSALSTSTGNAYGIYHDTSTATLLVQYSVISARGASGAVGIHLGSVAAPAVVRIDDSQIMGVNKALNSIDTDWTVRVTGTTLEGGVGGLGTFMCLFSDDGNSNQLNATCQ